MKKTRVTLFVSCACAAISASPAMAQQENNASEIIVTARSKGESLMDVPVAVSALTAEDVARYGTTDLVKLAQIRPDVEIYTGGSGAGASFIIRGVGTTADTAGVEPSVSIAMDGVQTLRPRIAYAGMFDTQQVEIMKGPQALFFGKNASAGVISIKTADPTEELSGYVRGGYEFEARERYVEAAVSIPVTETLGVRVAGRYSKLRGWIKNIAEDTPDPQLPSVVLPAPHSRYNNSEFRGGRVTVKWEPSAQYSAAFKATFTGTDGTANAGMETLCSSPPAISLNKYTMPNVDCKLNGVTAMNDLPPLYVTGPNGKGFDNRYSNGIDQLEADAMLLSLEQNLDLGSFSLRSITGHSTLKFAYRGNSNFVQLAQSAGGTNENFSGWSQELRLVSQLEGPLNFALGGFWEKTRRNGGAFLYIANLGADPTTGSWLSGVSESRERQRTWSLFGQATFDITPELELAGGVRYTKVKKHVEQGQPNYVHDLLENTALLGEGKLAIDDLSEDNWSPEATLTWKPDQNNTLYVAYKTGYKTGGISQPALVAPGNVGKLAFKPEKSVGGELGYKGQLLDRRVQLTATAFYYKFKGLQITSYDPEALVYRVNNAADVKQKGVEVEGDFKASDTLSFRASAAYLSVKYSNFPFANCWGNQTVADGCSDPDGAGPIGRVQDLSGKQLHRAPKFVAGAGFTYDTAINSQGSLRFGFSGDVRFRGGTYTNDVRNPAGYQGKNALIHASARLYDEDKGWEIAVIGRNLTNKRLIAFVSDRPTAITPGRYEVGANTVRPREIAIQGSLKF